MPNEYQNDRNTTELNNSSHTKPIDEETGFEISDSFQRFNQRDDIFCRAQWDDTIRSKTRYRFHLLKAMEIDKLIEVHDGRSTCKS